MDSYLSTNEKLSVSWQFLETCGVTGSVMEVAERRMS